jgi:hypothetical protein
MKRIAVLLFILAFAANILTGCGGGSSASTTGSHINGSEGSLSLQVSYPQDQKKMQQSKEEPAIAYYLIEVFDANNSSQILIQSLRMDYPQTQATLTEIPIGKVIITVTGFDGENVPVLKGSNTTQVTTDSATTVEISMTPVESPTSSPTETVSPTLTPTQSPTESPTVTPTVTPTSSPTQSPSPSPTDKWTVLVSYPSMDETSCSCSFTSVCEDGSIVVFDTTQQLITEHSNSASQIYLYATATGTLRIISENSSGQIGNQNSKNPVISGNGKMVAFSSGANNLLGAGMDQNGVEDIFAVNLENDTIGMISVSYSDSAVGGNNTSDLPSLSYDGSRVAYQSKATNLVPAVQTILEQSNIFLTTISKKSPRPIPSNTQLISNRYGLSTPMEGSAPSENARISGNGLLIAYQSTAADVVSGPTPVPSAKEIILCDLQKPIEARAMMISQKGGVAASGGAWKPFLNYDGTKVVFESSGSTLGGSTSNDVYIWELGNLTLVNVPTGSGPTPYAYHATIDKQGRYIAFQTYGVYDAIDTNAAQDVYVWDSQTNTYTIASVDSNGNIAEHTSAGSKLPFISGDGSYITFISEAKNLAQGPPISQGHLRNGVADVYLRKWK